MELPRKRTFPETPRSFPSSLTALPWGAEDPSVREDCLDARDAGPRLSEGRPRTDELEVLGSHDRDWNRRAKPEKCVRDVFMDAGGPSGDVLGGEGAVVVREDCADLQVVTTGTFLSSLVPLSLPSPSNLSRLTRQSRLTS